jgi:predicted sulfurtransferase
MEERFMNNFLEKYIKQLIKFCKVPKFQNERAISILLSMYLEEIVKQYTGEYYTLVTIELPYADKDSNRSNNIDYFMLNETKGNALLIELKTEEQGSNAHFSAQIEKYRNVYEANKKANNFVELIKKSLNAKRNRLHKIKYKRQQELIGTSIEKIKNIDFLYIAPDHIIDIFEGELNKNDYSFIKYKLRFSYIIEKINIDDNFETVKGYIKELNSNTPNCT